MRAAAASELTPPPRRRGRRSQRRPPRADHQHHHSAADGRGQASRHGYRQAGAAGFSPSSAADSYLVTRWSIPAAGRSERRGAVPAEGLNMSAAEKLLSRLQRVKRTGPGRWIASSPTREDRHPSLAIRELDDGRILVHDFGGDDVASIMAAVGLDLTDLFPAQPGQAAEASRSARSTRRTCWPWWPSSPAWPSSSAPTYCATRRYRDRLRPAADRGAASCRRRGGVPCLPLTSTSWPPPPTACGRRSKTRPRPGRSRPRSRPTCRRRPTFDGPTLLPKTLCEFVLDEADRMPCSPDYVAAALIVALGVGDRRALCHQAQAPRRLDRDAESVRWRGR